MTDREIMQQALDALDYEAERGNDDGYRQLRDALRERLAQPEQELVIDCPRCGHCCPRSKPLTDEAIWREFAALVANAEREECAQLCETKHFSSPIREAGAKICAAAIRARGNT